MMYQCSWNISLFQNNILHLGDEGDEETSFYKIKLLFPAESQKNDRNNTPFMALESRERKEAGHVLYAFLILINPTADQCEKPRYPNVKKITPLLLPIESRCKQCNL